MAKCSKPLKLPNKDKSSTYGWDIVPCGKCLNCTKRRISSWTFRLEQQSKDITSAKFITLTYETTPYTKNHLPTLKKSDFQKFLKRLRKSHPTIPYTKKNGKTGHKSNIKYYACGEYGSKTHRPHYHAIIFNVDDSHLAKLEAIWSHGQVHIAQCNLATISYTLGYLKKPFTRLKPSDGKYDDRQRHFSVMSKNLGLNYLTPATTQYHKERLQSFIYRPGGIIQPLPRYYRDKIFSEEEKILINEALIEIQKQDFEKLFKSNYNNLMQWQENQERLQKKLQRLERTNL